METVYEERARVFKALCDARRQQILELLQSGEKCACVLMREMNMPQSSLSYHMKILCDSGIVASREEESGHIIRSAVRAAKTRDAAGKHHRQETGDMETLLRRASNPDKQKA